MTGLIGVFLWSEDMIGTAILVFFVGLIALVIGGIAKLNRERAEALAAARMKYRTALDELKNDPTNPNLREATLESGKAYARLCRQGSVAIFDEAALANDIDVAAAAHAQPQTSTAPSEAVVQTQDSQATLPPLEERLTKLKSLREKGLIDEDEFREKTGIT